VITPRSEAPQTLLPPVACTAGRP